MSQVAILLASILLIVVVQQLRAFLARVFPDYTSRRLPAGTPAPAGYADLFDDARAELAALGFVGPDWFLVDAQPPFASPMRVSALFHHPQQGALFTLFPSANVKAANRLTAYVASRLADGRVATSQAFDPYFALMATPETPAQTLAPATLREHWDAHQRWIATLGSPPDRAFAEPASIADASGPALARQRDRLLALGRLRRDADGCVRARWPFALRMLLAWHRCPKPPKDATPVPPPRLALLAAIVERVRQTVPPARVQWTLFAWSAALFAFLGAYVWDARYALLLLVVIGIHELGHFVAMRAFGYRNVHMLALPLIGGVTIGHETQPSAHRRAWMSLMGPLPGIVIGWLLLLALPHLSEQPVLADWTLKAATLFLVINYLNVLPIPPLDGARVLQALLPPRWHAVQAGVLVVTCATGFIGAMLLGMTAIAVLAAMQLLTLPTLLQNGRSLRALLAEGVPAATLPRPLRVRRALDALQRVAGPARAALPRVLQAEAVLSAADQQPMRWWQRSLLVATLGVLLVVPVGAGAVWLLALRSFGAPSAATQARIDAAVAAQTAFEQRAQAMSVDELVHALAPPDAHAADAAALAAAEARIGQPLPAELRALYLRVDGIATSGVAPVGSIRRAEPADLADVADDGTLRVDDARGQTFEVPLARVARWLRLAGDDAAPQVYYDPDATPALPGLRVVAIDDGEANARPDLRALFAAQWIAQQQIAQALRENAADLAAARATLRDRPLTALLDELPQPTLVARVLFHQHGLPGRADASSIDAASQRIGAALPDDLLELYRHHDGLPPLGLFQVEWLERVDAPDPARGKVELERDLFDRDFTIGDEAGGEAGRVRIDAASLSRCVVAGGYLRRDPQGAGAYVPRILWCPGDTPQPARWIELTSARIYPSFRAWLLDKAATMRASRG